MEALSLVVVSLLLLVQPSLCSWTQQYGDPASTNHVMVPHNLPYKTGWSIKLNSSNFYTGTVLNPAVSDKGVIFVPLRSFNPEPGVAAITPSGERLWTKSIGDSFNCPEISNVLYSEQYDSVYVGCGKSGSGNESHTYYFVALDPATGDTKWTNSSNASEGSKLLSISEEFSLLYFFRIPTPFQENLDVAAPEDTSCILYVSLKDGHVVSNKSEETCEYMWMGFMQTKVGFADPNQILLVPYHDDNEIVALNAKNAAAPPIWSYKFPASSAGVELSNVAFAPNGEVYGTLSAYSGNNPKAMNTIFGLKSSNGAVLFTIEAACDNVSAIISSPAVDSQSVAYFSCGNQVIAIDDKGTMKWKSTVTALPYDLDIRTLSPAVNEHIGLLYFVNSQTSITVLAMATGHLVKTIPLTKSAVVHPPVLVGDKLMYVLSVAPVKDYELAVLSLPQ